MGGRATAIDFGDAELSPGVASSSFRWRSSGSAIGHEAVLVGISLATSFFFFISFSGPSFTAAAACPGGWRAVNREGDEDGDVGGLPDTTTVEEEEEPSREEGKENASDGGSGEGIHQ